MLGPYLGVQNLLPTVNGIVNKYPNDILGAGKEFLQMWNDRDEDEPHVKLKKLQSAYSHLDKAGIFNRGKF